MPDGISPKAVAAAFSASTIQVALGDLNPLRPVTDAMRRTRKYSQIIASVREIGMVEPLMIARDRKAPGKYLVLDGHLRLEVLKELGEEDALCLIASEDEGYTYNNRINRLAIIQEHKMILHAIERGVPEDRLAAALNVKLDHIRRKRRLLDGICADAALLLEDKHVSINTFDTLKKMVPERQVEVAQNMVVMNKFTISYAKTLLAATPEDQLAAGRRRIKPRGVTDEQLILMQRESANLDREFRLIEESYGPDHLDLVLAKGYIGRLVGNERVSRYLQQHHKDMLSALIQIKE